MALIIEDGTIVANAESFATVADLKAYAAKNGESLALRDAELEVLLRSAMAYLHSIEDRFQGVRYDPDAGQLLCFPRFDIEEFGVDVDNTIPQRVKDAQCQLALDAQTADLLAPDTGKELTSRKIAEMTWNYSPSADRRYRPNKALAILKPLLNLDSAGINLLAAR